MIDHKDFLVGLEDLKNLREKKRILEEQASEVGREVETLVQELCEYMTLTNTPSIRLDSVGMCSMSHTKSYSIDNPEAFESWMRANDDLSIVMAIHAKKVHAYYAEKLANNEELPPGIKTFVKTNITIRG